MWRIEWIFNEHEHLTEIFRDFPTEILSRMKIRVAEFTFNWPRRIFHATLFLEQRTIHFGLHGETAKHAFIIDLQLVKTCHETIPPIFIVALIFQRFSFKFLSKY